jgi:hypothetical protein
MPDSKLRGNPMLAILRKLIGSGRPGAERPAEYVFSLDPRKRRLYLLDLKAILRLPDARLALPNVANLDITVRRNRERIRIPCNAMRPPGWANCRPRAHRLPARSPLLEIMRAMPELAGTGQSEAAPDSSEAAGGDSGIRLPPIPPAEQEAEVARIRELIAHRKPAPPTRGRCGRCPGRPAGDGPAAQFAEPGRRPAGALAPPTSRTRIPRARQTRPPLRKRRRPARIGRPVDP